MDFIAEVITCIRDKDKKIVSEILKRLKKFMIRGFFQEILRQQIQTGSLLIY